MLKFYYVTYKTYHTCHGKQPLPPIVAQMLTKPCDSNDVSYRRVRIFSLYFILLYCDLNDAYCAAVFSPFILFLLHTARATPKEHLPRLQLL